MRLKLIPTSFPHVPFIDRFDYWNNLATYRKLTISPTMDAIRARFHRIAFGVQS